MPVYYRPHEMAFRTTIDRLGGNVVEGVDQSDEPFTVECIVTPGDMPSPKSTPWNIVVERPHIVMFNVPDDPASPVHTVKVNDTAVFDGRDFIVKAKRKWNATPQLTRYECLLSEVE